MGVTCPLELSTYFRINNEESGQFERTLIIADKDSKVSYLEGCTAPKFDKNQLHAAVVELSSFRQCRNQVFYGTKLVCRRYTEVLGGIYNFVTKRGLCAGIETPRFLGPR